MTRKRLSIASGVLLVTLLLARRWIGRGPTEADDQNHALVTSGETVAAVARAERHNVGNTLTIAGEFKPFQDVDVHAKVAGYIKVIYVDVGDHVKQGQTIAILEVPELAAQLAGAEAAVRRAQEEIGRAQGDFERAKSTHGAMHSAYTRLSDAAKTRQGLVAQQELDDSQAKDLESQAQVSSAKAALSAAQQELEVARANQRQVSALSDYTRISAPYAGVVTNRYADTGALIAAGTSTSTQAIPVVRIAQISVLRLVLPIPESVSAQIHVGDPVKVHVEALNQDIQGKVSRFADSLDLQTRTMATEIDFDNRHGRLIPGMYAQTQLSLAEKKNTLTIPLEAVARNADDATVLALTPQNVIEERHLRLGLEDEKRVEVVSGLQEGDRVVIGNRSQFREGQKVQPKEVRGSAAETGGGR